MLYVPNAKKVRSRRFLSINQIWLDVPVHAFAHGETVSLRLVRYFLLFLFCVHIEWKFIERAQRNVLASPVAFLAYFVFNDGNTLQMTELPALYLFSSYLFTLFLYRLSFLFSFSFFSCVRLHSLFFLVVSFTVHETKNILQRKEFSRLII